MSNKLLPSQVCENLFSKWKVAIEVGELDRAEEISINYLEKLFKKRCTLKALSFIDEIKLVKPISSKVQKFEILFTLMLGDNEKIKIFFPNLVEEYLNEKNNSFLLYKKYYNLLKVGGVNWATSQLGYKFHLIEEILSPKEENSLKVIKNYIFCTSHFSNDMEFVLLLMNYSIKVSKKVLAEKCLTLLSDNFLTSKQNLKYEKLISSLDMDKSLSTVDLGTDLFTTQSNQKSIPKVLKLIDQENTTFFDLDNDDLTTLSPLFIKVLNSLNHDELASSILENERHFLVLINSYSEKELIESYQNLVVIFNQMSLYNITMFIFHKIEQYINMNDYNERLEYSFLLIETLRLKKKFYLALNELELIFEEIPLLKEERKCYLYIKAEVLYSLKKYDEALMAFKNVIELDHNYRLTKVRVREIEEI